jgi:hypothetical protein
MACPGDELDPQTIQKRNLSLNQCPGGFEATTAGSTNYLEIMKFSLL